MPGFPNTDVTRQFPYRLLIPELHHSDPNISPLTGAVYVANDAEFVPFEIDSPVTIAQLSIIVAVQSGNVDIGIYTLAGTRLVSSGSTACGAAGIQTFNITDTVLARGRYYLGFAVNNAVATFLTFTPRGGANVNGMQMVGARRQATAFPLPATATFVIPTRVTMLAASLEAA